MEKDTNGGDGGDPDVEEDEALIHSVGVESHSHGADDLEPADDRSKARVSRNFHLK